MATACGTGVAWTRGCGLTQSSVSGGFGSQVLAYDESGQLVGVQESTDYDAFACPTDPSMRSHAVQSGWSLDDCSNTSTCECDADAGADAGLCTPTDAGF